MQELIPVNIIIADRSYRIKINPSDEGTVRQTLKTINDKIIEYKTQFAGKDMQDYVSMVILWYATQAAEPGQGPVSEDQRVLIQKMEEQLDRMLG